MNTYFLLLCHGKSLEILEERIGEFASLNNIVWGSMSTFDIPQKYILDKIGCHFTVVYDSSTVKNANDYELIVRIPRLINYLTQNKINKYICTKTDKHNLFDLRNRLKPTFNEDFKNQIVYAEDLNIIPQDFKVSLHLYIACLIKLGYKNIILFGADGGGKYGNSIESYYKWEEVKKDKEVADNLSYNMVGDSNNINSTYEWLMNKNIGYVPEILNCSPDSVYTVFKKITYDECLEHLKNNL